MSTPKPTPSALGVPPGGLKTPQTAEELRAAFEAFNQVSAELTAAYDALQVKVASLSAELAVANGELRRQYEEKQALSDHLSLLLNALPAGVVTLGSAGEVAGLNPAAQSMFGDGSIGQLWTEVSQCLQETDSPDEWWLNDPSAPEGRQRIAMAEAKLDSGQLRILLVHDVSAAHRLKASLERSERLAAMGEMAASLAHQLRTPLSTALLYTANLGRDDVAAEARKRFAGKASDQLKRLERLIHDVLLFARGHEIGREVVPVVGLIEDAEAAIEAAFGARGIVLAKTGDVPDDLIMVGSRKALVSALVSLLENAAQVSPEGSEVSLRSLALDGEMVFRVCDRGPGVPRELANRIFEPFFTTRAQGTGLGLAIAQGVARAHGGVIDLCADVPTGACFELRLPAGRQVGEV